MLILLQDQCMFLLRMGKCREWMCVDWVSAGSGCVWTVYVGLCKKSGCRRLRVFSPRTGQLQEYCSIKCKNLDTTRPGTVLYTQPHLVTLQFVLNRKYWAFCIFFLCVWRWLCVMVTGNDFLSAVSVWRKHEVQWLGTNQPSGSRAISHAINTVVCSYSSY